MARSAYTRLRVVLDTMMGRYHPSAHVMDAFVKDLMERETYLEEQYPRDQGMIPKLPALLT